MVKPVERVRIEILLTPEEYDKIKNDARWDSISDVAEYMRLKALGFTRRGC